MSIKFSYNYPQVAREAGFRLRQYKDGPIEWRLLGSYEIERLLRDQNLDDIDRVLVHLSEAPIGNALLDTSILDPAIAKFFIVSQFAIQYLLFCRNFLDETVQDLRESHTEAQFELARTKKLLSEANNEILQLHKKVTQMEAIHEVIYPCHFCTKNFANNEALNLHIRRKHPNNKITPDRKTETPVSATKDRTSDLTLINTIKLELEIKHLKERLNNAEKEIKERREKKVEEKKDHNGIKKVESAIETRNVAIQSNLTEEKEKNDSIEEDIEECRAVEKRKVQIEKLQKKIYEIEEWRMTQMANSEEFIAEINKKLTGIAQALEGTIDAKKHSQYVDETDAAHLNDKELERRLSVEDLERVLSEKVAEIGKASTEKLEEIVHNMENNYCQKLFELEREVKKSQLSIQASDPIIQNVVVKQNQQTIVSEPIPEKRIRKVLQAVDNIESDDNGGDDGTYEIEKTKNIVEVTGTIPKHPTSQATESNHTFVKKTEKIPEAVVVKTVAPVERSLSDDTNISESLSDDSKPSSDSEIEEPIKPIKTETEEQAIEDNKARKSSNVKLQRNFSRNDAKHLVNKRLSKFGCDMRMKSLSIGTFNRINTELNEKRSKIKQQYPSFNATRNKIKRFVDKLCTTKSTEKAQRMLIAAAAYKPMKVPRRLDSKIFKYDEDFIPTSDEEDKKNDNDNSDGVDVDEVKEKLVAAEDFKKRLEQLLASPVQMPMSISGSSLNKKTNTLSAIAQVHNEPTPKPMPLPRKRVMFQTENGNG